MRRFISFTILASVLLLAACREEYSWKQRLTVTVQTPDGVVSGSSVTSVTVAQNDGFWVFQEARGPRAALRGEAVVVEVAPGQYLFVLLDGMETIYQKAFPEIMPANRGISNWAKAIANQREPGIVPLADLPPMVTFNDISDPSSVRSVDPSNLEESFGEGVSLLGHVLEITTDEEAHGVVERVLYWWPEFRSGPLNSMTPLKLPNDSPRGWRNLSTRSFWSLDHI